MSEFLEKWKLMNCKMSFVTSTRVQLYYTFHDYITTNYIIVNTNQKGFLVISITVVEILV